MTFDPSTPQGYGGPGMAPAKPPFYRRKGCIVPVVLAVLACGLLGGYSAYVLRQQERNYEAGHAAYQAGDCQTAIGFFDQVINSMIGEDSDPHRKASQERKECSDLQQAARQGSEPETVLAFNEFVKTYPSSPLRPVVDRELTTLFSQAKAETMAAAPLCQQLDTLLERKLIPEQDQHLPSLYFACGQTFEDEKEYGAAVLMYERFRSEYSDHALAEDVTEALARASVAEARAAGAGALPAPQTAGASSGGKMVVIIRNDSPERLSIVFSGPESRVEEIDPCTECQEFSGSEPEGCPGVGPVAEYTLTPGSYNVVVRASGNAGVTPFYGQWDLEAGQEYNSCFYLVSQ